MRPLALPWTLAAPLLAVLVFLLGTFGAFRFLWVFPLDAAGFPVWVLICAADIFLYRAGAAPGGRVALWAGGLLFFCAGQDAPLAGFALVLGAGGLALAERLGLRYAALAAAAALVLFTFGHDDATMHPGLVSQLGELRFSVHLVAAFALFRMLSWLVAVRARGARPGVFATMEYFLAPAFWLSPLHASHLVFDRMQAPARDEPGRALGWIARGFGHALVFSVALNNLVPWLERRFRGGASSFRWWEWALVGPVLFGVAYFEKSRVSYVVAGCLRLAGRDVEPDFRSPWRARDLLEYWRRFHFWLWEYYVDLFYLPFASLFARRLSPRLASIAGVFATFTLGTGLVHWVHYPAPFLTAIALGVAFGFATALHATLRPGRFAAGIPFTWLTVFVLYFLAYPAFGLGWGLAEIADFFRR